MRCENCGVDNREGSAFCRGCGTPLPTMPVAEPPKKSKKGLWIALAIVLVVVLVGGACFLLLPNLGGNQVPEGVEIALEAWLEGDDDYGDELPESYLDYAKDLWADQDVEDVLGNPQLAFFGYDGDVDADWNYDMETMEEASSSKVKSLNKTLADYDMELEKVFSLDVAVEGDDVEEETTVYLGEVEDVWCLFPSKDLDLPKSPWTSAPAGEKPATAEKPAEEKPATAVKPAEEKPADLEKLLSSESHWTLTKVEYDDGSVITAADVAAMDSPNMHLTFEKDGMRMSMGDLSELLTVTITGPNTFDAADSSGFAQPFVLVDNNTLAMSQEEMCIYLTRDAA